MAFLSQMWNLQGIYIYIATTKKIRVCSIVIINSLNDQYLSQNLFYLHVKSLKRKKTVFSSPSNDCNILTQSLSEYYLPISSSLHCYDSPYCRLSASSSPTILPFVHRSPTSRVPQSFYNTLETILPRGLGICCSPGMFFQLPNFLKVLLQNYHLIPLFSGWLIWRFTSTFIFWLHFFFLLSTYHCPTYNM